MLVRLLDRSCLRLMSRAVIIAASLAAIGGAARGQTSYPVRPVQVIVPFPAGGSVDVMARNLVTEVAAQLGQPFVVVNREGASGTIGFGQSRAHSPMDTRSARDQRLQFRSHLI